MASKAPAAPAEPAAPAPVPDRTIAITVKLTAARDESDASVVANRFAFTFFGETQSLVTEPVASWSENSFSKVFTCSVNDNFLNELATYSLFRVRADVQRKSEDAAAAAEFVSLPNSYFVDVSKLLFNEKSTSFTWRRATGASHLPYVRAPPGLSEFSIAVSVEEVLMDSVLLDRWTPIKIDLDHLATLPLPEKCSSYEQMDERYAPVYCRFRFPTSPEWHISPPRPHAADALIGFGKVFLLPAAHHKYDLTYGPPRASFSTTTEGSSSRPATAPTTDAAEGEKPVDGGAPLGMTSAFSPTVTADLSATQSQDLLGGTMAFAPRRSAGARAISGLGPDALAAMWKGYEKMMVEELVSGLEEGAFLVECHDRDPQGWLTDEMILGYQALPPPAAPAPAAEAPKPVDPKAKVDPKKAAEDAAAAEAAAAQKAAADKEAADKAAALKAAAARKAAEPLTHLYGVASFSLVDFCGGSNTIRARAPVLPVFPTTFMSAASMSRAGPAPVLITSAPVAPPSGPADPYAVHTPIDPYTQAHTYLTLNASALQPPEITQLSLEGGGGRRALPTPAQVDHKFARACFVIRYADDARLQPLLQAIGDANAKAMSMEHLPRRSLVNVQLSEEQRSDNSTLDIITGFTVIDPEFRIICIEGLKHGTAMPSLYKALPRTFAHSDDGSVYLQNSSMSFRHRIYTSFDLDLKAIKLTKPLAAILRDATMYTRSHIPDDCYRALDRLNKLRKCDRLAAVKAGDLFVRVSQLLALEKRFGGFVSDEDIEGMVAARPASTATAGVRFARPKSNAPGSTTVPSGQTSTVAAVTSPTSDAHAGTHGQRRKAATDAQNPEFEAHQAARAAAPATDFIAKHITDHTVRFRRERETGPMPPDGQLFLYSGQRRNYRDWAMGELRKKVVADGGATYVYGQEFNTLTFPYVDEREEKQKEIEKTKLINAERFKSPLFLPPHHVYQHKYRPTDYRIEELHSPWQENPQGNPLDNVRVPRSEVEYFKSIGKPMFDTVPARAISEFGMPGNDQWNVSVHQGGDGVEAQKLEAAKAAKEEWQKKVVVDTPTVQVYFRGNFRQNVAQTDRLHGLLHDPPTKASVKFPSNLKLEPPPISINTEPWDPQAANALLRKANPAKFIVDKDFRFPVNARELPQTKHTVRAVSDLRPSEYSGPLFRSGPVSNYE